jgi:hypothetical protein
MHHPASASSKRFSFIEVESRRNSVDGDVATVAHMQPLKFQVSQSLPATVADRLMGATARDTCAEPSQPSQVVSRRRKPEMRLVSAA